MRHGRYETNAGGPDRAAARLPIGSESAISVSASLGNAGDGDVEIGNVVDQTW